MPLSNMAPDSQNEAVDFDSLGNVNTCNQTVVNSQQQRCVEHNSNAFESDQSVRFCNLESPLLQIFADRIYFTDNTFRNILEFLKRLLQDKRQVHLAIVSASCFPSYGAFYSWHTL